MPYLFVVLGLVLVVGGLTLIFKPEPKRIDLPPAVEQPAPLAPAATAPSAADESDEYGAEQKPDRLNSAESG